MSEVAWTAGLAAVVAALAATVAATSSAAALPTLRSVVVDDEGETPDTPLSGYVSDRAVRAALAHTDGGQVTETEVGDDGAAYGVEIRKADGTHVEVELDAGFAVVDEELDED
jgi:uncharacterized membrane protein YkoI